MKRFRAPVLACGAALTILGLSAPALAASKTPATGNPSKAVTLNEDGSSLLYPYLQVLAPQLHHKYSHITLNTAPGGSGKGISDAINGTVQMGGSDAYLSPGDRAKYPGLENVPIAISAQDVNYNVPGVQNMNLSGNVLAQIYEGKITNWDDGAIAALNPGVKLPNMSIVPVRRVDSSGDTFIFTSFLTDTNSDWANGPGFGTTVTWPPVSNEVTAHGNPGMVQTCKATPGCVAYIGISVEQSALAAGLGQAQLLNKDGNFVHANYATIHAAVAAGAGDVPANLAAPLIYEPGAQSYPIVNMEYLVVQAKQSSSQVAEAIRTFLSWAIVPNGGATPGNLAKVGFIPLPSILQPKVYAAIDKIS